MGRTRREKLSTLHRQYSGQKKHFQEQKGSPLPIISQSLVFLLKLLSDKSMTVCYYPEISHAVTVVLSTLEGNTGKHGGLEAVSRGSAFTTLS